MSDEIRIGGEQMRIMKISESTVTVRVQDDPWEVRLSWFEEHNAKLGPRNTIKSLRNWLADNRDTPNQVEFEAYLDELIEKVRDYFYNLAVEEAHHLNMKANDELKYGGAPELEEWISDDENWN